MADCTVVVQRNIFARLPAYNPFVGTFHHAPSAGNRGAAYFSGDIVGISELEERKKFRHHPLTGIFHSLPGYYDPLHRLCQFRNDDEGSQADTDSVRSFVAMDLHDTGDLETTRGMGAPKTMSRMYSDSHFGINAESQLRPRRFSDSDAESFYELNRDKQAIYNSKQPLEPLEATVNQCTDELESMPLDDSPLTRLRSKTLPLHKLDVFLREVHEEVRRHTKKRKSSSSSAQSTESDSSTSADSFVHLLERTNLLRSISSSELNNGFISTGKGIFRKIGVRPSTHEHDKQHDRDQRLSDKERMDELEVDCSEEYTQAAPREPLNPFVARRLNDGDELRIMAVHRHNAPRECVPHLVNSGWDVDDESASQPKPYFIHEEAVTEQYELVGEDQLGDGSYAVVKPAIHRANGKEVAIKQIHKRYLTTEDAKAAVEREIEIHLRLRHRHIIRLYEVYETNDFLYLVMTKANKGNLKQLMQRKRRLPESLAAKMAQQIVRAVFFLHHSGVLHCDLKPENILLTDVRTTNQDSNDTSSSPTGLCSRRSSPTSSIDPHADVKVCDLQVELCDFGLSVKVPDVRYYKLTGDVHKVPFTGVTGTPGYIAPELLQQQSYGKPVDMWSVGIVIFEMLTGYQPFYPAHACIHEKADFNDRVWKDISGQAKDLVMHLLESDPAKRFTASDTLAHTWFDTAAFAI